ncbi:Peptidase_M1 domain-containing protein [Meloidogyne graminicola]|uniref:Transcription initiation factor TFIID subunit 2 n=1 Tax=Meloidogyne graminicola TaxID=189291 RepID=A0A8S9ZVZ6_9BILA|nr:Peptidase_M1 domain-containing protein [Meloidogyne graminicola]
MRLAIDSIVYKPKNGIKFVLNNSDEKDISSIHLFTFRSNLISSTKEWLPCVDSPSQLCVWKFEFTVPKHLTAICCGDLIDTTTCVLDNNYLKTFHYQLLVPSAPSNIGFAIGDFQMYVQPEMPEIISFVLPSLMPLLRHTMTSLNRIFVFFEELLSCRFPYSTYWQIFVDQSPDELTTYSGISIFSLNILYHKKILDTVQHMRQILAKAVAQQFFGCFIDSKDFSEIWLIGAISSFITGIFVERFFGTCEYLFQIQKFLKDSCEYESRFGAITLRSKMDELNNCCFDRSLPELCSLLYLEILFKRGHLILRMLDKRLPKEQFIKVLQRILSIGMQNTQNLQKPSEWSQLLISLKSFMGIVTDVTGQEFPSFIEQWIDIGGHVEFNVSHAFNRKRNVIELELRQIVPTPIGCQRYAGPLTIIVQEIDGHFVHTIQVDAAVSKHDIQCHSKGRKLKRKKVILGTGEEVEMDLSQMDADSPILWIRVDPEMLLLRQISMTQPFYQWEFILLYDRDVLAQQQAIEALHQFPRHQALTILEDTVRNEKLYYRIRKEAAFCLVHIYNNLPDSQLGKSPPLVDYIKQSFCCKTCPDILQANNYVATSNNLQNYFLFQSLPSAIGSIRGEGKKHCPSYIVEFLLGLIRLNDNSMNRYSDDYQRGSLIHALGKTLVMSENPIEKPEEMSVLVSNVLEEVTHSLNMDMMKPSFQSIVSTHCLQVLYELQRCHHIPQDTEVFWKFGLSKNVYAPLRFTALACIVAMIRRSRSQAFVGTILRLIDVILTDQNPYIRYSLAHRLCIQPPFEYTDNCAMYPLNTKRLCLAIWTIISNPATETRVRIYLSDLYFILYGSNSPTNFSSY